MAPPLIFLAFVIVVVLVVAIGAFVAVRTGLWVRETSEGTADPAQDTMDMRDAGTPPDIRREDPSERPSHIGTQDPTRERPVGR